MSKDAKSTIFGLLSGTIEKDDMSEILTSCLPYLVINTHLHVKDIMCIKAGERQYLLLPEKIKLSEEDRNKMHVDTFVLGVNGYNIYIEHIRK
jgi:hypothetical protein